MYLKRNWGKKKIFSLKKRIWSKKHVSPQRKFGLKKNVGLKKKTSWVCRATLEFNYRLGLGLGWVGVWVVLSLGRGWVGVGVLLG